MQKLYNAIIPKGMAKGILTAKGTKDVAGLELRNQEEVIGKIKDVFESFGFEPLETPLIEREETLLGKYGDEAENQIFILKEPHSGGLRFDHTVPLARFAGANWQNLPKPYKRYSIGPVFRAENTQSGRLRQFIQCDFDTLGSANPLVDAEIPAVNFSVLTNLGFTDEFIIHINDRKFLNAILTELNLNNQADVVLRAWDKLDKISVDEALQYAKANLKNQSEENLKLLSETTYNLIEIENQTTDKKINSLKKMFKSETVIFAINSLETLIEQTVSHQVPQKVISINPLLSRGLNYYTGPIFETTIKSESLGSITGGGRYDNLIAALGGPNAPASGSSFGLDRIIMTMEKLNLLKSPRKKIKALVTIFDSNDKSLVSQSIETSSFLRKTGINTRLYQGESTHLSKQLELANKENIPYTIIIGPEESAEGLITIKNMTNGSSKRAKAKELPNIINQGL